MTTLTVAERKLAAVLLEMASDTFSNHGCNDFDLEAVIPDIKDRRELVLAMHTSNGDPENFDPNHLTPPDWWLMSFLGKKLGSTGTDAVKILHDDWMIEIAHHPLAKDPVNVFVGEAHALVPRELFTSMLIELLERLMTVGVHQSLRTRMAGVVRQLADSWEKP